VTRGVVVEVVDEVIGFCVDANVVDANVVDDVLTTTGFNCRPIPIGSANVVSVVAGVFVDDKS
jgi:hypothetical protein